MRLAPKQQPKADVIDAGTHTMTDAQLKALVLLRGPQRHTALVGGARAGKTVVFLRSLIVRAIRVAGSRHAVLRLAQNAIWPSIGMDSFPFVMKNFFPDVTYKAFHQLGYFLLPNGAEVWLGGLDDKDKVDKILGREYATIYFNECSQIAFSSVVTALSRLAQNIPGLMQRAYYDLNPVGKGHWSNVQFGEHKDPVTKKPLPDPHNYARMFMNPEDNRQYLTPEYIESLKTMPIKQRERFYSGKYVDENENALWTLDNIERGRIDPALEKLPDMQRIVIAIDPSGARNNLDIARDMIGIIVAGLGTNGHGYILADLTLLASPKGWSRTAIAAYHKWNADIIVAETNFGGAMVGAVLLAEDDSIPYKEVTASRGKVVRAEPVSTLYGDPQNMLRLPKIHHVGQFLELEDEMTDFTDLGYVGERSPNRVDALVWAITELMLGESVVQWLEAWKQETEAMEQGKRREPERRNLGEPRLRKPVAAYVNMMGQAPGVQYAPHKARRYLVDADRVLNLITPEGMRQGVDPEDVEVLSQQGCTIVEMIGDDEL